MNELLVAFFASDTLRPSWTAATVLSLSHFVCFPFFFSIFNWIKIVDLVFVLFDRMGDLLLFGFSSLCRAGTASRVNQLKIYIIIDAIGRAR